LHARPAAEYALRTPPLRPTLSAFLIVHNEARRLPACLASLGGVADEIVVLDDGSTDDTVAIARAAGATVATRPFDDFGHQKQAALELTSGAWVLSIDADEVLTPALVEEIRRVVMDAGASNGYWIRRELTYLGAPLRFGGTGRDWVLRLARRSAARFALRPVHEHLVVDGATTRLRSPMRHVKYATLSEHVAVIDRYTTIIAAGKAARGGRFRAWHILRIPYELLVRLVVRAGILDGRAGIIYGGMAAFYAFLKYAKLYTARRPDG